MSWIRRTATGRGRMCLPLTATSALVIGLAWAMAPAPPLAVKLAAAAKLVGNTTPVAPDVPQKLVGPANPRR